MPEKGKAEIWTVPVTVPVRKESKQVSAKDGKNLEYVEPRFKPDDLLYFLDVNVWHKRCVFLKAAVTAGLGWQLVTDDQDKEPDADYKKIMELLNQPNGNYSDTLTSLMIRFMIDYHALGNAWLEVPRRRTGEVAEIYHIPGKTMRRKSDFSGYKQVRTFKTQDFTVFGERDQNDINEVVHLYNYDPGDDYYGVPDWLPAIASMALDRTAVEYQTYLYDNQLMATFAITIEGGELSRKARNQLTKFLQNNFTKIKNAGKAMVIAIDDPNVKIKIDKLDIDMKSDMTAKAREINRDEIVAAHGVPPRMVGIMAAGQLGGGGEISGQLKTFKETVVLPDQQRLENMLNRTILASFGEHKWKIKFTELDISDQIADAEYYEKMLNSGVLDADEVREELGKQPRENPEQMVKMLEKVARVLDGY